MTDIRHGSGAVVPLVFVFLLVAAAMVLAVPVPPVLDYPNHLARIWLLAGGVDDPFLASVYSVDWNRASTNIGIDLLAATLGPLVGAEPLARSFLYLAIVLPPLGAIALGRAIHGSFHPWQLSALFLAFPATMIGGFLNFQIGLGLALAFAVVDLRLIERHPVRLFAFRLLATAVLVVDHIFAAGFYMVLMGGLSLPAAFAAFRDGAGMRRAAGRIGLGALACLAPIAFFAATAPNLPGFRDGRFFAVWNSPYLAVANLLSAITSYDVRLDMLFALPIAAVYLWSRHARRTAAHAGLLTAVALLTVLSLVSPRHAMGTGWICWRFPIMAMLTALAAVRPLPLPGRREAALITLLVAAGVFGRMAVIGAFWWQGRQDAGEVAAVLSRLPHGARVLPLAHFAAADEVPLSLEGRYFAWRQDTFRHLATLATPLAGAFVPTIFTARGKQPLVVRPPFDAIAVPEGDVYSIGVLSCPALFDFLVGMSPYLADWRQRFDYVLVLNADLTDRFVGTHLPAGLERVAGGGFAELYAIDHSLRPAQPFDAPPGCPGADDRLLH